MPANDLLTRPAHSPTRACSRRSTLGRCAATTIAYYTIGARARNDLVRAHPPARLDDVRVYDGSWAEWGRTAEVRSTDDEPSFDRADETPPAQIAGLPGTCSPTTRRCAP